MAAAIVIDHEDELAYIVAEDDYAHLIDLIQDDIAGAGEYSASALVPGRITEDDPDIYINHITRTKQYIRDGDIFQANLSRNWTVDYQDQCDPIVLFQSLSRSNPAQFAALVKFQDQYIISSSPERLISVKDGIAQSRPIAGTHPRGDTPEQDAELSAHLLAHPKEQAEHVMLIDLVRNDLGRFCEAGSIQVTEKMVLESYEHVHHIVSNIRGRISDDKSVADIVHAVFPGGDDYGLPEGTLYGNYQRARTISARALYRIAWLYWARRTGGFEYSDPYAVVR